jgi:hypothetical protein
VIVLIKHDPQLLLVQLDGSKASLHSVIYRHSGVFKNDGFSMDL